MRGLIKTCILLVESLCYVCGSCGTPCGLNTEWHNSHTYSQHSVYTVHMICSAHKTLLNLVV